MNFLEGLKRLFVIAGVLATLTAAFIAWDGNGVGYGCRADSSRPGALNPKEMKLEIPPAVTLKEVDFDPFAGASKPVKSGERVPPDDLPDAGQQNSSKPWEKYQGKNFSFEEAQQPAGLPPYEKLTGHPKNDEWKNFPQVNSVTNELCPDEMHVLAKRVGLTFASAATTAIGALLFWLLLRWTLIGFFPAWGMKKAEKLK